jgi:chromosomal replication initiation ATPase DnaA
MALAATFVCSAAFAERSAMSEPTRQLVLDLALEPRFGRENFLVSGCNEAAYETINLWPRWPDQVLLLVGPEGAGKTHLGNIWAEAAQAAMLSATDLAEADVPALVKSGAVLLEDAEQIGPAEAALFHLLNMVRESRTSSLLLTSRGWPDTWGLRTADLLSRLRLAPTVAIEAPDDGLLRAVLVKLLADRQIAVDASLIDYIAQRIERSFKAARAIVAALDLESLSQRRPVTKAMAGEILRSSESYDA